MEKQKNKEQIDLSPLVDDRQNCLLVEQPDLPLHPDESDQLSANDQQNQPADFSRADAATEPELKLFASLGLPARYRIVELLGEGGMAHVYKAIDTENGGNPVAIKILRPEIVPDPTIVERFFREAKAAQKLAHRNIVQVRDYGRSDKEMPYLIMEYVPGRNLAQIIAEEGHLVDTRAIDIFMQVCQGLREAHKIGTVHRDLKPSNILIATEEDGTECVKITDFGIAKPPARERWINPDLTKTGAILGSPAYMSPEQCQGHVVDERSDIYSFGCLMYETLCGTSPFASDTPVKSMIRHLEDRPEPFEIEHRELNIPTGLETIIMKCLQKEPAKRFQTVWQLQAALPRSLDPGIIRRFCADAIDATVLLVCCTASVYLARAMLASANLHYLDGTTVALAVFIPSALTVAIAAVWAYIEHSDRLATPGKRLTGLKIIDANGSVIPLLSFVLCGLAMAIIQLVGHVALAAGTIVNALSGSSIFDVYTLGLLGFAAAGFCIFASTFLNNGRCNFFDMLIGRAVVRGGAPSGHAMQKSAWLIPIAVIGSILAVLLFQYCLSHQLLEYFLK